MGLADEIGDDVIVACLGAGRGYCLEHVFFERPEKKGFVTG
jgi:hypothetical protein